MRKMRRSSTAASAFVALALVAAACGGNDAAPEPAPAPAPTPAPAPAAPGDPIAIGSLHPLTGGLAQDGIAMDEAAQMAVDDINAAGGIASLAGTQLVLVSADSQGSPDVGATEAQRMIDGGVVAIIGAYQSAVSINVAALAERSGVPFVIDVTVADAVITDESRYTFRIQPNATDNGVFGIQALVEMAAIAGIEIKSVAHLYDQSGFGASIHEALMAEADALGIDVVEKITYNPFEVSDLTTELARVAASGADALINTGYYGDGVLVARGLDEVRPANLKIVFGVASGAFDVDEFPSDVDGAGEFFFNSNYHYDATSARVSDIRTRYEARFGKPMRTAAVLSYQAIEVVAAGLEAAGSADRDALRDGISGVVISDPLVAGSGPIQFDERGENLNARPIVMQVLDGAVVQVYPVNFKEADFIFGRVPWRD